MDSALTDEARNWPLWIIVWVGNKAGMHTHNNGHQSLQLYWAKFQNKSKHIWRVSISGRNKSSKMSLAKCL